MKYKTLAANATILSASLSGPRALAELFKPMSDAAGEQSRESTPPPVVPLRIPPSNSSSELDVTIDHEAKDGYFPYNEEKTLQHVRFPFSRTASSNI